LRTRCAAPSPPTPPYPTLPLPPTHDTTPTTPTHRPTHARVRSGGGRVAADGRSSGRGRPPLQDEERAARAADRAAKAAPAAATKAASGRTSKHHNVSWSSRAGQWRARVWDGNTPIHLGYFDEEDDAGREVDKWTRDNRKEGDKHWKFNFGSDGVLAERQSSDSSKYRGVYPVKKTGRWQASIWDGTSQVNIGTFATQEGAAEAYDARALELGRPTNFNQYGECNPPGGERQGGAATRQVGRP
jgi:hypothetical protein